MAKAKRKTPDELNRVFPNGVPKDVSTAERERFLEVLKETEENSLPHGSDPSYANRKNKHIYFDTSRSKMWPVHEKPEKKKRRS
jgi:hypothetical protein